jgi:hypothetical protein
MKNLYSYSDRVQSVLLYTFDPPKFAEKATLKCRDISDTELYKMRKDQDDQIAKKVDEAWIQYKKQYGLSRPEGDLDALYTDLYEKLQQKKKDLETQKKKSTKTYVPPSMRGKVANPEVDLTEKIIQTLENEIEHVKKLIELDEQIWENGKKTSVYDQLLQSVC